MTEFLYYKFVLSRNFNRYFIIMVLYYVKVILDKMFSQLNFLSFLKLGMQVMKSKRSQAISQDAIAEFVFELDTNL